ncbi:ankyrin repeat domain-containing protein [Pelagicoccus sp. SDUM812005]|uniref:ankyrin repeat domain-containing protein n=1 Tax=Pelagicoccus sp. SDUM812005 TaxID=3041257 RepID=UPI00280CAC9D|nr:ankyrin repeat domain-containing protein [Pelagicoccus sp. SDUM812005]MDQ8182664.1 ankyrin repeat domain-containing protein [Pelagicoccus sp. SDUM812005]
MPKRRLAPLAALLLCLSPLAETAPTTLPDLAEANDTAALASLLTSETNLDAAQVDGMTALHWACYHDNTPAALALLEAGAHPSPKTRYGITPISIACQNGNSQILKELLQRGADPNTTLNGGETLLMTAARVGKIESVQALLKAGATIEATERNGQTALMWAADEGHVDVVKLLIESGADMNRSLNSGYTPFFFAVRQGHRDLVKLFLDLGADVNAAMQIERSRGKLAKSNTSPLILAMENGHFDLALDLLERGADPNDMRTGLSPLHTMVRVRKPDRGEGIDGEPPPLVTGSVDSLTLVRALVEKGADVNARLTTGRKANGARFSMIGCTPFLLAADTADLPYMKLLIELGADYSIPNEDGTTSLMVAAGVGSQAPEEEAGTPDECLEAVKFLVSLGAKLDTVASNGDTAMHGAAYKNAPQVIAYLDEQGADIQIWNTKNENGWTPLFIAEGYRPGNFKPDFATIDAIKAVMQKRGVPIPEGGRPIHVNYAP